MKENKKLVIKYDYTTEKILKASTVKIHQNSSTTFHGEGNQNVNIEILEKDQILVIPNMSESFLIFREEFLSVEVYLLPTRYWSTLPQAIARIKAIRENFKNYKTLMLTEDELDLNKLTIVYFEKRNNVVIGEYELEHYKIFFIMKRLDTPKEFHPREEDLFQLIIRIDNQSFYKK